jgi:hypothetical protein
MQIEILYNCMINLKAKFNLRKTSSKIYESVTLRSPHSCHVRHVLNMKIPGELDTVVHYFF